MKAVKILTHPYLLILSFCVIMISGQNFGGVYLIYLLMALPYGGIHAILALGGVIALILANERFKVGKLATILNLAGASCLFLSLYFFFYNDKAGYNSATFEQTVPQISLVLFAVLLIGFVFYRVIWPLFKKSVNRDLSMI
ncbi:MAG: hypothetical protein WDN26_16715 [Chitinophagaceae bacterium]